MVIPQLCKRLEQEARRGLMSRRQSVATQMAALDALSPLAPFYSAGSASFTRFQSEGLAPGLRGDSRRGR